MLTAQLGTGASFLGQLHVYDTAGHSLCDAAETSANGCITNGEAASDMAAAAINVTASTSSTGVNKGMTAAAVAGLATALTILLLLGILALFIMRSWISVPRSAREAALVLLQYTKLKLFHKQHGERGKQRPHRLPCDELKLQLDQQIEGFARDESLDAEISSVGAKPDTAVKASAVKKAAAATVAVKIMQAPEPYWTAEKIIFNQKAGPADINTQRLSNVGEKQCRGTVWSAADFSNLVQQASTAASTTSREARTRSPAVDILVPAKDLHYSSLLQCPSTLELHHQNSDLDSVMGGMVAMAAPSLQQQRSPTPLETLLRHPPSTTQRLIDPMNDRRSKTSKESHRKRMNRGPRMKEESSVVGSSNQSMHSGSTVRADMVLIRVNQLEPFSQALDAASL